MNRLLTKKEINKRIDDALVSATQQHHLKPINIAHRANLSRTMIESMEGYRYPSTPNVNTLRQIATAIGIKRNSLSSILMKSIGSRVKSLRIGHKLTRSQLAKQLHISRYSLVNIEVGRAAIKPDCVGKMSSIFHVSNAYILCGTDKRTANTTNILKNSTDYANSNNSYINVNLSDVIKKHPIPVHIFYNGRSIKCSSKFVAHISQEILAFVLNKLISD